ncbi:acyltransferase [Bacillus sp. JZ8]
MVFATRVKNFLSSKIKFMYLNFRTKRYKKILRATDKNLSVFGFPIVLKEAHKIEIGKNCRLNEHVFLHGGGKIIIGDNVTFSAYSKVISWTYDTQNWRDNFINKDHIGLPIHIGEGAWIGAGAIILPGVNITGKGVIVAAGSVVNKDIKEDFVLVGGMPAKVLKKYK